jgi:site-specific DNA-methyltransferase (adenine-specific)
MVNKALFSSNSDEWSTPSELFDKLNKEFDFNLDPCSNENNHKCENYYTIKDDGLSKNWGGYRVFCNPPYSNIAAWVKKAWRESTKDNTLVVLLIPARTDTKYFHEYIYQRSEIRFIKGRLKFGESKNSAPFPSMIVIFRSGGLV